MRSSVWLGLLGSGVLGCSDPTGPEVPIEGKRLFDQYCARCHGSDGRGTPEHPAAIGRLSDPVLMQGKNDNALMETIRRGKPPPAPGQPAAMPAFGGEFTDAKIMVLVAYVRSLSAPPTAAAPPLEPATE